MEGYEGNDFGPTLVMPSETTPTDLVEEDIPSRGDMVFNTYSIDKYFVKCGFVSGGTQNPPCDKKLLNVADTMVILFTKSQSQITKPAPPPHSNLYGCMFKHIGTISANQLAPKRLRFSVKILDMPKGIFGVHYIDLRVVISIWHEDTREDPD